MKLVIGKSKNNEYLYISKSYRDPDTKKSTTKVIEKLGKPEDVAKKYKCSDPYEWARNYAKKLTNEENKNNLPVSISFSPTDKINKNMQRSVNGGYLYLKDIYHKLYLDDICKKIQSKYKFKYNLDEILQYLIFSRIIYPGSKKYAYETTERFIEKGKFGLHQTYRALDVLAKEHENIEAQLYKNSQKLINRKTGILYYDVTNYYFDIDYEDNLRKYGKSKNHIPKPIVNMGFIMDYDGMPLSFNIFEGNKNENTSLRPIEEKIINDYEVKDFVMCTDAGLSSLANKKFNTYNNRSYITVQSIKKLKKHLKTYCLDDEGWYMQGSKKTYNISKISSSQSLKENYYNCVFYKDRWINENNFEEHLIVTFSFRYQDYARSIREKQIERAKQDIINNRIRRGKNQNDPARFISETNITNYGEVADTKVLSLDTDKITTEENYDGFYALVTNLDDDPGDIARINHNRWKIEKCFRDLKTEFKSGTIYLSKENRIKSHFLTCFIALLIFRLLENKLNFAHSTEQISKALREYNFLKLKEGYIPAFTRTNITDSLQEQAGISLNEEITTNKKMQKIKNFIKHRKYTTK